MRAAAGIVDAPGPVAAEGGLILKDGTFDTLFTPSASDYARNPWHGVEVHQTQVWNFPRPGEATSCGAPYHGVKGCGCGIQILRDYCDRLECSFCELRNRDRRARDIWDRLNQSRRGRPVIYTIFTLPPSRRETAADPKTWKKWLRNLIAFLKKEFDLEYAAERSDPAGEDGERWHPHINLLWVRRSGKGWIDEVDLDRIKARWKKIVGLRQEDPIDVQTQYSRKERRIRFWCRYLGQPWPRWAKAHKYLLRVKWFGKPPKVEKPIGDPCCPKCGLDVVCLKVGSQQAAEELAARGYEHLKAEWEDRKAHFRRQRPAKFHKVDYVFALKRKET